MSKYPKQACVNCHFLMKEANSYKLEVALENRESICNQDYSWLHNHYSLACYCGIWDEGYNFAKLLRHETIVVTNRESSCFFWQYRPGMLFPAAEKLQNRQANSQSVFKERKLKTILFLAANPTDTERLQLDEEVRAIDERLRRSEFRDVFDLKQHWAVRISDIQECFLRYKPHIVHFSGHGSRRGEIILQNELGQRQPVSIAALGNLFSILKDDIRCVVLNACYSNQQAQIIAQYIDCVVGMSHTVMDSAAISFAASFYQALGYGRSIKTAFDLGCGQIELTGLSEQETPKLLAPNADPDRIFIVAEDTRFLPPQPTGGANESSLLIYPYDNPPYNSIELHYVGKEQAKDLQVWKIYKDKNGLEQRILISQFFPQNDLQMIWYHVPANVMRENDVVRFHLVGKAKTLDGKAIVEARFVGAQTGKTVVVRKEFNLIR